MLVGSSWLLEKISGFFLILNSLFRSIATQAPINDALCEHIQNHREPLETILRRVLREELERVEK
jgi:hypothetical protein